MRFFAAALGAFAFAAQALAQSSTLQFRNFPSSVSAGQSYTITYVSSDINSVSPRYGTQLHALALTSKPACDDCPPPWR